MNAKQAMEIIERETGPGWDPIALAEVAERLMLRQTVRSDAAGGSPEQVAGLRRAARLIAERGEA